MNATITIRQFTADDWQSVKRIRLQALQEVPQFFGSNFAKESQYNETDWRDWIGDGKKVAIFGLFASDQLIGITGIVLDRDDPTSQTALLIASYIEPEWRGRGLSDLLYRARLDWARRHATVRKIVVSHRQSNEASRRANQRHGFVYTHSAPKLWHDGQTENDVFYQLLLEKPVA